MATEEAQCITDPCQLLESGLAIGPSNLAVDTAERNSPSQPQTRQARLVLLQPLATCTMLAACRKPSSCMVPFPDGRPSDAIGDEYLDISPLSRAWRQALAKTLPVPRLTFNLSLPKPGTGDSEGEGESDDALQRVYWDTATPARGRHLAVAARDVMHLVTTIATTMRMRVQGDVRFEVVYDEDEGLSLRAMKLLKKQLLDIAEAKEKIAGLESARARETAEDTTVGKATQTVVEVSYPLWTGAQQAEKL